MRGLLPALVIAIVFGASSARAETNERYLEGLSVRADVNDPIAVFRHVFARLSDRVVVYPSENYYYLRFTLAGYEFAGSIALFADSRDDGRIVFGYEEVTAIPSPKGGNKGADIELGAAHGVRVAMRSNEIYDVTFANKTVTFILRDPRGASPKNILEANATLVGSTRDESGLEFHLVYNTACKSFAWILREDDFVPETFDDYSDNKGDDIRIGRRTGFAFHQDRKRKILIGVIAGNVAQNNWLDGPFDQLPDNAIQRGEVDLRPFLEDSNPTLRGRIDRFGIHLGDRETREALTPYIGYSDPQQLVRAVHQLLRSKSSKTRLYCAITPR